jgi:predicted AlkP superfamily phosphohydrolase/phosphomutase
VHFIALRIEPLDILTHAHFAESVRDGQDDGSGLLFEMYRYIDWRIAAVSDALDRDDVLLVVSDHGIQTSMEHSKDAMWIAHGSGVPSGRTAGQPSFRGVSRAIADLLDVPTDWPDEGVAPWAADAVGRGALPASQSE